jgi:hypothetical protein
MSTKKELEFSTIKTIKVINKDSLLQTVYSAKFEKYNHSKIIDEAYANQLADGAIEALRDIYDSIILHSDFHTTIYNTVTIEKSTPRRYGKKHIQEDIKTQNGVATPLQETMLLLADLKAVTATLHDRGVSDRFKGTEKFDDAKLRKINSAIRDLKIKLTPVLKTK